MKAYKFLKSGAVGPYSGFSWPTPGERRAGDWVEVEGPIRLATNAIHACRVPQLPFWLDTELWEVELGDPVRDEGRAMVSGRGRLLGQVDAWTADVADDLARSSVERVRGHAASVLRTSGAESQASSLEKADEPEQLMAGALAAAADVSDPVAAVLLGTVDTAFAYNSGMPACLVAYLAARAARCAAEAANESVSEADREERRWQASWLVERLGLTAT